MSVASLAILLLLFVAASRKFSTLLQRARSPLVLVPGPWYSKYTSLVLKYYFFHGKRAHYVERLHQRYGKVVRISPTEVDFSSITAAKTIHPYTRPFAKAPFYRNFATAMNSENVFTTSDHTMHGRHRRLLTGPISESSLRGVEHIVEARVTLAVERIGEEMKRRGHVDVMKWWFFMATDIIGELSFGDSFRMLEQGRKTQYALDLEALAPALGIVTSFPTFYKLVRRLGLPIFRNAIAANKRLLVYAQESIQRYDRMIAADPWNPKPTLFTKLFRANEKEEKLSQMEIVADAQGYIVAGSDTTAHTMTYLIWSVCRDPRVKERLVEEVVQLREGYRDEDLKSLPYLNQVINETLRLFAAAPDVLPRDVPEGGCKVDGYWMPDGTVVSTQAYSMHRDPAVFPEPERFHPLRWESPTKEMKDASMPFGGGARICLGLHLAMMELRLATTKFFRAYPNANLSNVDGFSDEDMEQMIFFLMFPKNHRCLIEAPLSPRKV